MMVAKKVALPTKMAPSTILLRIIIALLCLVHLAHAATNVIPHLLEPRNTGDEFKITDIDSVPNVSGSMAAVGVYYDVLNARTNIFLLIFEDDGSSFSKRFNIITIADDPEDIGNVYDIDPKIIVADHGDT